MTYYLPPFTRPEKSIELSLCKRMGAVLAVALTGSDDQGETKTGLDAPSYRFPLAMRRVHRAGTGLRLFLLGTVRSMQSSNITVVKETARLVLFGFELQQHVGPTRHQLHIVERSIRSVGSTRSRSATSW